MRLSKRSLICAVLVLLSQTLTAAETVEIIMTTSEGPIEFELYAELAPLTVNNFLRLIDGEHLDGGAFYRVISYDTDNGNPNIEIIQGGIGDADSPFDPVDHESTEQSGIHHLDGAISMARGFVGTASSEFFICIGDQPALDFGQSRNPDKQGFAAFGKVVHGMDIVRKIKSLPADAPTETAYVKGQILNPPVRIESVRRK